MTTLGADKRKQLAAALAKNPLLPELLDERRGEIRDEWEAELDPEQRERLWHELKATLDLKDFLYGRLGKLSGGDT